MSPLPYADASAFRRALLTRLKSEAAIRGVSMQTLQQRLLMERMLVRLFSGDDVPWVLKGGFALDLRFRPRARVTRDLDLGVEDALATDDLRDQLESALASVPDESDDFLVFTVGRSSTTGEGNAVRFAVRVRLAGKDFGSFSLDAATNDPLLTTPQRLASTENLGIEGLVPADVRVLDTSQHFAEKLHALTKPWETRENTRVKDLVDLVLLIERGDLDATAVAQAVRRVFQHRDTHPVPETIGPCPESWRGQYPHLASEADLRAGTMQQGLGSLRTWLAKNEILSRAES